MRTIHEMDDEEIKQACLEWLEKHHNIQAEAPDIKIRCAGGTQDAPQFAASLLVES